MLSSAESVVAVLSSEVSVVILSSVVSYAASVAIFVSVAAYATFIEVSASVSPSTIAAYLRFIINQVLSSQKISFFYLCCLQEIL